MVIFMIFLNIFWIMFYFVSPYNSVNMIVFDRTFNYSRQGRGKKLGEYFTYVTTIKYSIYMFFF